MRSASPDGLSTGAACMYRQRVFVSCVTDTSYMMLFVKFADVAAGRLSEFVRSKVDCV